jgi:hypothetical protein
MGLVRNYLPGEGLNISGDGIDIDVFVLDFDEAAHHVREGYIGVLRDGAPADRFHLAYEDGYHNVTDEIKVRVGDRNRWTGRKLMMDIDAPKRFLFNRRKYDLASFDWSSVRGAR